MLSVATRVNESLASHELTKFRHNCLFCLNCFGIFTDVFSMTLA